MANVLDLKAPHSQREKHAADHQGHEDGLGRQAAPRAGAGHGGAPLRQDDHQRARVAYPPRRHLRPETGNLRHPLFATREEKRVLLVMVTGDKGFAGAFNNNIIKATLNFVSNYKGREIDIEAMGRKGRDQSRRRYPVAVYSEQTTEDGRKLQVRAERKGPIELTGDHPGMLEKLDANRVFELAENIISRYVHEEIDAAYIVYNEFKSVISQRVVVERLLPIIKIGAPQIAGALEPTEEERERAGEAAISAGMPLEPADTREADEEASKFGTAERGLHLRAAARGTVQRPAAAVHFLDAVSRHDGVGGRRARRPHDRHGCGIEQRLRHDRRLHAADEPRAPGRHHQGDHRDRQRRGRGVRTAISFSR